MEEPSRLSSGGSSMLKAADADQAYAETNRKPICILTTNSWNPQSSLNGPRYYVLKICRSRSSGSGGVSNVGKDVQGRILN
jgi:hypothetical protein